MRGTSSMSVLRSAGYPGRRRGLSRAAALRLLRAVPMYVVLAAIMVLITAPFFWMVSSAFKDQTAIYANPPEWIPSAPTTQNFIDAWNQVPFGWFLVNSLKVAGLITLG